MTPEFPTPSAYELVRFTKALAFVRENAHICRARRSTLTCGNAQKFLPYIRAILADPASGLVIPRSDFPTCKLSTLYLMWQGALQYYIESTSVTDHERQTAALIRTAYIAKKDEKLDALVIRPRTGVESTPKTSLRYADKIVHKVKLENPSIQWKEEFLEWVTAGEVGVPWIKKSLALDNGDIEFVRNICEDNGWEHDVTLNQIKVVKV